MKAEQCLNESAFAGAVRSEQANGSSIEGAVERLQYRSAVEEDGKILEFDCGDHCRLRFRKHKDTETQRHRGARIQIPDRAPLCLCVSVSLCFSNISFVLVRPSAASFAVPPASTH